MTVAGRRTLCNAANIDLFLCNVNKDVTEDHINKFMKENKNIEILDIEKKSHADSRTKSFRVQI